MLSQVSGQPNIGTTPPDTVRVLVAARPGLMRNALTAFLIGIAPVYVLALTEDASTTAATARARHPDVLVVDGDLSEVEVLDILQQLRAELPALRSVILANTLQQQRRFLAAGASRVLLKGLLDDRLTAAVLDCPRAGEPA
jgi:two-component system response regulator DesR